MSYTNDMASPEIEIAGEASGSFFADSRNKHSDLKAMLDGNKDNLKMDAMKRIINMIAKGKDASDLFPAVVKNVAAKNVELKKLVYVYLMRYAEEQQDLALLSISTFQRALKDPNQLIRASALRVLSSIRVAIIAPIMMLSIRESVRDMSPYVRKVAANAISKLFSLDPDLKDQLIEVIDQLLADRTTLVLGSAVHAFEEVCPERIDLIHKHYRKLCQLLVDVDEWGQVVVINMLTRYARTQFLDPNSADSEENVDSKFYSSTDDSGSEGERKKNLPKNPNLMDADLRMLLRNTKPLLQSRNSAVVLAVSQLYYYLAPKTEVGIIAKALIRLLRAPREVQSIILTNIATVSANRRSMFEPYLKSFFVRSSDPTHIKLLKLEILTNLATQSNISMILREFQTYVATQDKEFAAATIDAIGRCACNIKEVTDVCLSGLVNLLANKNETVVAQSVVVIKKLLQSQPSEHKDIIKQMAKLIDSVKISAARASIVWLIGEYCERVPKIAPDVLRKMAITFGHEDEYVKLQILNLAVKLYLTNKAQSEKLVQYVFQLAKYDLSYDLRDRARFLRNLVLLDEKNQSSNRFAYSAKSIFINQKPAPVVESSFKDRDQFQLGTLSHYLNQRCCEYKEIPEFPEVAPDPSVRQVAKDYSRRPKSRSRPRGGDAISPVGVSSPLAKSQEKEEVKVVKRKEKFYSDEESEKESEEEDDDENDENSDEDEEEEEDEDDEEEQSESEDDDDDEEENEEEIEEKKEENHVIGGKSIRSTVQNTTSHVQEQKAMSREHSKNVEKRSDIDNLLLDLNFDYSAPSALIMQPTADIDSHSTHKRTFPRKSNYAAEVLQTAPAQYTNRTQYFTLLDKISGRGLSVSYLFTRTSSLFSNKMCSIELRVLNETEAQIDNMKFIPKKISHGMDIQGLCQLENIAVGQSKTLILGVDFADTTQCASIELVVMPGDYRFFVNLIAPVGEQLEPVVMTKDLFKNLQSRLSGMNETSGKLVLKDNLSVKDFPTFSREVYQICNVMAVPDVEEKVCFAGQTLSAKCPVLISFAYFASSTDINETKLTVNCEKMVVGSMLFKQLKSDLSKT